MAKDSSMVNRVKRFTIFNQHRLHGSGAGGICRHLGNHFISCSSSSFVSFGILSETILHQRSLTLLKSSNCFGPTKKRGFIDGGKQFSMDFLDFFPGRPGGH